MTDTELPSVSVLMPAYNYAGYIARAIGSALEQEYPAKLLKLVVVDDGSTDDTASVVAELADRNPGRIELISQANAGPSAAINRALSAADGELLAVLDADDVWLSGKTRRQVDELIADPELGMVFCDMTVIDSEERLVRPSQVGRIGEFPRRAFARLLVQNVATQSSIMVRRSLVYPIPSEIPYSDWWFALRAAEVAEILYIPEPLALYREHGANLTSGTSGASAVREHRKEIAFQLWALRNLELGSLRADELAVVWAGVEEHARRAMAAAGSFFVELTAVLPGAGARVAALLAEADALGPARGFHAQAVLLLRALAHDPFSPELRTRFTDAVSACLEAEAATSR
jgi:glycosyltransferase involved in cell wall biosynthesis